MEVKIILQCQENELRKLVIENNQHDPESLWLHIERTNDGEHVCIKAEDLRLAIRKMVCK